MTTKVKNIVLVCFMAIFLLGMAAWCVTKAPTEYSESERRVLAVFPEITAESLADTSFMKNFETYTQDQFPLRETFRSIKALTAMYALGQKDNNDLYYVDGHLGKLEYPLNQEMLDHAADRFGYIYNTYLNNTDTKLYFSIVPDKNYFLAETNGYLHLDYNALTSYMQEKTDYMEYIDIFPLLTIDDYYTTDSHWRQEEIGHVADHLLGAMGAESTGGTDYTVNELDAPFYGVYHGQSALHVKPDTIRYLTSDVLEQCIVTLNDSGMPEAGELYDMEAAHGKDPYEMFTGGSCAIVTVENPMAQTDKELVIFRDSFAGSLTPLLVEEYAKITLVDIRYVQSDMLSFFLTFDDQDVLFLYSASLLNNSLGLK